MRKWIGRFLGGALLVTGLVVAVVYLALPRPDGLASRDPAETSFMRFRTEAAAARGESLEIRHRSVPLSAISPHLVGAVILAEDARFRSHHGVDWAALAEELRYDGSPPFSWLDPRDVAGIARAAAYYHAHRDEVRGRSTITQQLAKNLYFTPDRSLVRKAAELMVARRLERALDKDRILELYLNTVELGPGVFGVDAAARHYFGVTAARLDAFQAASLAATLPHPLTSNPGFRPARMAWRRDLILARMAGEGAARPVASGP